MTITKSQIVSVSLLSLDQYLENRSIIPLVGGWWWLRTPGTYNTNAAYVFKDGEVYPDGYYINKAAGVRPTFELKPAVLAKLSPGVKVIIGNHLATVLNDGTALLDDIVCKHIFDPETNNWQKSELKSFLKSQEFNSLLF